MKKLLLLLLILSSLSVFSQNNRKEIKKLKSDLKSFIEKDDEKDTLQFKKNRKRLSLIKNYHIDSTKSVIYDFSKKEYTNSNVIPIVGQPLVLKIKNINRLAYDVSIKSSDVAIVDENFNDEIKTAVRAYNEIPEKLLPIDEKKISSPIIKKSEEETTKEKVNEENIKNLNQSILDNNKSINDLRIKEITFENELLKLEKDIIDLKNDIRIDSLKKNESTELIEKTNFDQKIDEKKIKIYKKKNEI